ncbi:MAG: methyltransferase domain-containing protein [Pseudomonadota bacterium]
MDRETERLAAGLAPEALDACEISGNKWRGFGWKSYRNFYYPAHDITKGLDAGPFDIVIAEQVWEHLDAPFRALRNVYDLLRPGGYFLISVPFLLKWHGNPIDCMRWTREGLKNLLKEGGFPEDGIVAADWGNRTCLEENLSDWVDYDPARHDLENDPEFPVVSWALARKGTETGDVGEPSIGAPIPEQDTAYWADMTVRPSTGTHLGGNLNHGDGASTTPTLWRYLIDRFAARSVLDVGAGQGHAALFFHRQGVQTIGFDGLRENVGNAVFPLILHDLLDGPLRAPVDLVLCVELVEHIAETALGNLMDTLCNGRIVVMTHGLPGQTGHHHVNCQPPEYWAEAFAERGYRLSEEIPHLRALAEMDGTGSHFSRSGLVFVRQ